MNYTIKHENNAIKWFNSMSLEEKFYKTIAANNTLSGDTVDNHPNTLSKDKIIKVYDYHLINLL